MKFSIKHDNVFHGFFKEGYYFVNSTVYKKKSTLKQNLSQNKFPANEKKPVLLSKLYILIF
ncbi:MAG: hypothetical protein KDD28_12270, partial [Phaeodactylibacter sp.]|nr:hypothetical protein [Phaeodactylibacter sp.]